MLTLLLVLGAADAGLPVPVPPTGSDFNGFQVLGLTQNHVAVRELRALDTDSEEPMCSYPVATLLSSRDLTERPADPAGVGVTLWSWRLPPVGQSRAPEGPGFVVYQSARASSGCTSPAKATAALTAAKTHFADAGVSLDQPVTRLVFAPSQFGGKFFSPECFSTRGHRKGCSVTLQGRLADTPVTLVVNQLASSDCVTEAGETATIGCATSSRWRGYVELGGKKTPFDFFTDAMAGNSAYRLDSAVLWQTDEATVAALYFNWCYLSCRSRVPMLLRLR